MTSSRISFLALLSLVACGPSFGDPPTADPEDWARTVRLLDASGLRLVPAAPPVSGDAVDAEWAVGYRVLGHPVEVGVYRLADGADPDAAATRLVEARGMRREEVSVVANGPLLLLTVRSEIDMAGGDPEATRARDALEQAFEDEKGRSDPR